jgi:hypothetical protein
MPSCRSTLVSSGVITWMANRNIERLLVVWIVGVDSLGGDQAMQRTAGTAFNESVKKPDSKRGPNPPGPLQHNIGAGNNIPPVRNRCPTIKMSRNVDLSRHFLYTEQSQGPNYLRFLSRIVGDNA